ncbi:MAG: hypothetical protein Q8M79_01495 [Dehalococcoidia bacterium]|nr:hypothetical protein [Dehalococcoidia bacterium]
MDTSDSFDPLTTIDPMIVFMDAHRLLLLAIRDLTRDTAARATDAGDAVVDAIARVALRTEAVTDALRCFAADDAAATLNAITAAGREIGPSAGAQDFDVQIARMHDAHDALMHAYATFDLDRIDEAIATPDGAITVRVMVIEHALREGAEAYLVAAALGRAID